MPDPDIRPVPTRHRPPSGIGGGTVLSSWRDRRAHRDRRLVDHLRRTLDGPVALHRDGWRNPARVDPATAVGVAIDLCEAADLEGPAVDVVMSTLVLHASDGDAAAALVLDHARRKSDHGRHGRASTHVASDRAPGEHGTNRRTSPKRSR